uniref:Claudin 3c n=2 Tax=Haplochromini TaxID=319058 RepID=A0AAX7TL30_ASTCA
MCVFVLCVCEDSLSLTSTPEDSSLFSRGIKISCFCSSILKLRHTLIQLLTLQQAPDSKAESFSPKTHLRDSVCWTLWTRFLDFVLSPHTRANMSMGMEIVGIAFGVIGFLIAILSCALPMWRVTAFIGANIVTAQIIQEGLWMSCVVQSTGQMQCKVYDSLLALSQELQASRAMMVVAIILGVLGVMISIVGAKCTNCIEEEGSKAKVMIIAGVFFILSGLLVLIPVSWTANVIIMNFYNPTLLTSQKMELGASLYIGWAAAGLFLIGGAMLCTSCPPKEKKYLPPRMGYSAPRSISAGGGYDKKDYV